MNLNFKIKILLITLYALLLISCNVPTEKAFKSSTFELRQLVKQTETTNSSYGSYFLITGSYSSETHSQETLKVFAKVEGRYRLIDIDLEDVRIIINNSLESPTLQVEYQRGSQLGDEDLISDTYYTSRKVYIISCPERYLPEKLLPIEL